MPGAARKPTIAGRCLWCAALLAAAAGGQSSGTIYEQAAAYLQRGQPARAIALLEPRLQEAPRDLRALTLAGMAHAAENRRELANRYYRQALDADAKYAPALKNLAINEMALGDGANAKTHFEQLLQLTPADPMAHLALGDIASAAKDYRSALSHYEQSGNLYLRDGSSLLQFAQACLAAHQTAKAAAALERMPPEADAGNHFAAGALLASMERYAAAAREFERAKSGGGNAYDEIGRASCRERV